MKDFILAGNYAEFMRYCRERKIDTAERIRRFIYIDNPNSLAGIYGLTVIRIGTWSHRKDLEEIEDAIRLMQSRKAP